MCENAKIQHLWAKTRRWYRYQKVVPVPKSGTGTLMQWASVIGTTQIGTSTNRQRGTGTGTGQSGTSTTTSSNFVLTYFCTVKSRIRTPNV